MKFKGGHFAIGAPLAEFKGARCPGAPRSAAYAGRPVVALADMWCPWSPGGSDPFDPLISATGNCVGVLPTDFHGTPLTGPYQCTNLGAIDPAVP